MHYLYRKGTIDLPQLLARAYIPTPPADDIDDDSLLLAEDTESPGLERDTQRRSLRRRVPRDLPASSNSSDTESARRKATGGLRPITSRKRAPGQDVPAEADDNSRRITDARHFPQRKKNRNEDLPLALQPTSLHKLVHGIWEQIYGGANFDLSELVRGHLVVLCCLQADHFDRWMARKEIDSLLTALMDLVSYLPMVVRKSAIAR